MITILAREDGHEAINHKVRHDGVSSPVQATNKEGRPMYTLTTSSEEYGSEEFNYYSLSELISGLSNLILAAKQVNDGVERTYRVQAVSNKAQRRRSEPICPRCGSSKTAQEGSIFYEMGEYDQAEDQYEEEGYGTLWICRQFSCGCRFATLPTGIFPLRGLGRVTVNTEEEG